MKIVATIALFLGWSWGSFESIQAMPSAAEDGYQFFRTENAEPMTEAESDNFIRFEVGKFTLQIPKELESDRVGALSEFAIHGYKRLNSMPVSVQQAFHTKRQIYLGLLFQLSNAMTVVKMPKSVRRLFGRDATEEKQRESIVDKLRLLDAYLFSQASSIAGEPVRGVFATGGVVILGAGDLSKLSRLVQIMTLGMVKVNPELFKENSKVRYPRAGIALRMGFYAGLSRDGSKAYIKLILQSETPEKPFTFMPIGGCVGVDACIGIRTGGDDKMITKGTSVSLVGIPLRLTSGTDGSLQAALSVIPPVVPNPMVTVFPAVPIIPTAFDGGYIVRYTELSLPLPIPLFVKAPSPAACEISFARYEDLQ